MPTEDPQDPRHKNDSLVVDREIFVDTSENVDFATVEEAYGALSSLLSEATRLVVSRPSTTDFVHRRPDMAVTARAQLDTQIQE